MPSVSSYATAQQTYGYWVNEDGFIGGHNDACMFAEAKNNVSGEFSFNFSALPEGATIVGIEVLLHCICGDANDYHKIELKDAGGTWRAKNTTAPGAGTCVNCVDRTVGGATDLWDGTWTASHIKSTNFRIRVTAIASGAAGGYWGADYCQVTVYYTGGVIVKSWAQTLKTQHTLKRPFKKAFYSQTGKTAHAYNRPSRFMRLTQALISGHTLVLARFKLFTQALHTVHAWSVSVSAILKQWSQAVNLTHVFKRAFRSFTYAQALKTQHVYARPLRSLRLQQPLEGLHAFARPTRFFTLSQISRVHHVYARPFRSFRQSQALNTAHVFKRSIRLARLTHALNTVHVYARSRFLRLSLSLRTLAAWPLPYALMLKQWTASLNAAHVFKRPLRSLRLTQTLKAAHVYLRHRFTRLVQSLSLQHVWTALLPTLKQWFVSLQVSHVFKRPFRSLKLTQALNATRVFKRPLRSLRLTQTLEASHVLKRPFRSLRLMQTLRVQHVWQTLLPTLKQWLASLHVSHVFKRPFRQILYMQVLRAAHILRLKRFFRFLAGLTVQGVFNWFRRVLGLGLITVDLAVESQCVDLTVSSQSLGLNVEAPVKIELEVEK